MHDIRWDAFPEHITRKQLASKLRLSGHDPFALGVDLAIGPHLQFIMQGSRWVDDPVDDFPSSREWADEVERILSFASSCSRLDAVLPRLRGSARQRDAALAELRVAFFMRRNRFRILEWEPLGNGLYRGDLLIQWRDTRPVFVEVKAPDWQGELSDEERLHRKQLPKSISGEGRFLEPIKRVLDVVDKGAIHKLRVDCPNLIVVHDDLFVSPAQLPGQVTSARFQAGLAQPRFVRVGAILLLRPISFDGSVEYRTRFFANPGASSACQLPLAVSPGFSAGSPDAAT